MKKYGSAAFLALLLMASAQVQAVSFKELGFETAKQLAQFSFECGKLSVKAGLEPEQTGRMVAFGGIGASAIGGGLVGLAGYKLYRLAKWLCVATHKRVTGQEYEVKHEASAQPLCVVSAAALAGLAATAYVLAMPAQ
ncbi:MAG: hypothetical protein NTX86_03915 [Candidatus Dependentiae bacterium]|nr:hypothetical protein [Candidatus Dependentiae bacterium]